MRLRLTGFTREIWSSLTFDHSGTIDSFLNRVAPPSNIYSTLLVQPRGRRCVKTRPSTLITTIIISQSQKCRERTAWHRFLEFYTTLEHPPRFHSNLMDFSAKNALINEWPTVSPPKNAVGMKQDGQHRIVNEIRKIRYTKIFVDVLTIVCYSKVTKFWGSHFERIVCKEVQSVNNEKYFPKRRVCSRERADCFVFLVTSLTAGRDKRKMKMKETKGASGTRRFTTDKRQKNWCIVDKKIRVRNNKKK